MWADYPSIIRNEKVDMGTVLFRNSVWTREFLIRMYYHPACQDHLDWTEQWCFTQMLNMDFMGVSLRDSSYLNNT